MFHSRRANWFNLMVAQDDMACALEILADLGAVELETDASTAQTPVDMSQLRAGLETYSTLARRYRAYWPHADERLEPSSQPPADLLAATIVRVRAWAVAASPHIDTLQHAIRQEANLGHLNELVAAAGADFPVALLANKRGVLFDVSVHLLEDGRIPDAMPEGLVTHIFDTRRGVYFLAVGSKPDISHLSLEMDGVKARLIDVSEIGDAISSARMRTVPGGADDGSSRDLSAAIAAYIRIQRTRKTEALGAIEYLSTVHGIAHARASIARLRWLTAHVVETTNTVLFSRITGWSALEQPGLERAFDAAGLGYVLVMGNPPQGLKPPMLFDNPTWIRPFEVFVRLLGIPARTESDPSPLVALIAPLLFGFMFGDVGQGAVLLGAGLALRSKWPTAAILVPGGMFAMLFGFAFGSVFAREDIISAQWLHPLTQPIPVLGVALALGVTILLTGLLLNGAGSHWRHWWGAKVGLVAAYVGVLFGFSNSWGFAVTGAGALWFLLGSTLLATTGRGTVLAHAFGTLVETLFQLFINTLSFARVGAFAIAHAGLSSALVVLADIVDGSEWFWVIMVVGNVFIIALEGLVAGIQTTRLMLFEFFIRFLRAEGRPLRALSTPAAWSMKLEGRTT